MARLALLTILLTAASLTLAALPSHKIRGVNLGSLFIVEPWMSSNTWAAMGCGGASSEWDCVAALGQDKANAAFQNHWDTFINETDFDKMVEYGLNTVRIPVGHWFVEETIAEGENWPRGGMKYLDKIVGIAKARNISVILDLHAAPGVQVANNAFTGHVHPPPPRDLNPHTNTDTPQTLPTTSFYSPSNYARAYTFLRNITARIHTHPSYTSTIMLEILNEPEPAHPSLTSTYYPAAVATIRSVEYALSIPPPRAVTIQMMDASWGAGNPCASLPADAQDLAFDNHRYLTYSSVPATKEEYLAASCGDVFASDGERPLVIGEWSLAVKQEVEWSGEMSPVREENHAWYRQWWAAQVQAYEKEKGWVFWSWKAELGGDWRWSYMGAVEAGIISKDFGKIKDIARC